MALPKRVREGKRELRKSIFSSSQLLKSKNVSKSNEPVGLISHCESMKKLDKILDTTAPIPGIDKMKRKLPRRISKFGK